jgi:ABC-type Zn2+ transport system substrate-binding protein/surface adhesin
VSLKEQWDAARVQRQQEILLRQQQVLEHRYETQIQLEVIAANRAEMAAQLSESLQTFHETLQAEVAAFRAELRSQQEQVWQVEKVKRKAYVATLQESVWGTTPMPTLKPHPKPAAVSIHPPKR